jgi:hypothetical protein
MRPVSAQHAYQWFTTGGTAQCAPDPRYPTGIDLPPGGPEKHCKATLPYPAPCIGVHKVTCTVCGNVTAVTAAGRPDDPRSIMLRCLTETTHG